MALSSSLRSGGGGGMSPSAFALCHSGLLRGRTPTLSTSQSLMSPPSRVIVLRGQSSRDDPSLTNVDDYEWLKRSRPVRICARLLSLEGVATAGATGASAIDDVGGSSSTTKIVHFQRHGQGTHNELYRRWAEENGRPFDLSETDPLKNPLLTDVVLDAPLTQKGRDQCLEQRCVASELRGVELIVVSPLVRALETACITFKDHLPHKSHNSQRGTRVVKWIAHEGIREELGTLLCNKRRTLGETLSAFPHVDFAYLDTSEEDQVWDRHAERTQCDEGIPRRETTEDMSHRAYDFLTNFVYARPETNMAVVGHSAWLLAMTSAVLDLEEEDADLIMPMFGQAELRSLELTFLK